MNHEQKNITTFLYGDEVGRVQLIESWGSDKTIVNSARVSFGVHKDELDKRDKKLIQYLIKHRHTSTLEHCGATFKFVVPLYVRSQHHRHRTWSYNEISRRYTDINIQFYEPEEFRTQHESNRQASNEEELINPRIGCFIQSTNTLFETSASKAFQAHHKDCLALYNKLIKAGVCREQARGVLPQNMYTEYYGTVSLLNALKFISLRSHEGAQWEIRKVADAMLELMEQLWPVAIGAYKKQNNW